MKKVQIDLHSVQRIATAPVITIGICKKFEMLTIDEAAAVADELNRATEQAKAREHYTPAKPAPVPVATPIPSPVQVIACNGNVVITRHNSDKFAHIDIAAGGIGLDASGLRSLTDDLMRVADQIEPQATKQESR